jgi:DNA-binding LacI/PurR family transcriptional regulator
MKKPKAEAFIPTYQRLVNEYRDAILQHRLAPHSRIDSINELQEKHSVSRETAKTVLKILAQEGLIIQKPGKGSFVTPLGPVQKKWGVIIPFYSAHIEKLLFNLRYEATKQGRSITQFVDYNNWEEEVRLVGMMIRERYEAVIVVPVFDETKTAGFYRRLAGGGTVVTLLDHTMAGSYFTYAIQSYDLGVKRGADYLLAKTHGAIAFVKNDSWSGRNMVQETMAETFRGLLNEAVPERSALIVDSMHIIDLTFMRNHFVGGIFCCDDIDAIRILGRLREWGYSLPEDIALVSYGNTDLAKYFTPGITSVDAHAEEMASRTARIIQAHRAGEDVRYLQYVIEPELIVRET